jgi:hypothetical protein
MNGCNDRRRWLALTFGALLATAAGAGSAQQLHEDFMLAVANDRAADVRAMLVRGIDPNSVDRDGTPALVVAVREGNAATVDVLLAGRANVEARNQFGDTALMLAALKGRLDIVQKLRGRGAALDPPGWTALIYAATGGHDDVVRFLLAEGANIDAASPNGTSALMMAVRENRTSTAELLISRGANVNHRNENGASALQWAKRNESAALVARLQRAGARE